MYQPSHKLPNHISLRQMQMRHILRQLSETYVIISHSQIRHLSEQLKFSPLHFGVGNFPRKFPETHPNMMLANHQLFLSSKSKTKSWPRPIVGKWQTPLTALQNTSRIDMPSLSLLEIYVYPLGKVLTTAFSFKNAEGTKDLG